MTSPLPLDDLLPGLGQCTAVEERDREGGVWLCLHTTHSQPLALCTQAGHSWQLPLAGIHFTEDPTSAYVLTFCTSAIYNEAAI
jgi:hypothetical protein